MSENVTATEACAVYRRIHPNHAECLLKPKHDDEGQRWTFEDLTCGGDGWVADFVFEDELRRKLAQAEADLQGCLLMVRKLERFVAVTKGRLRGGCTDCLAILDWMNEKRPDIKPAYGDEP